MSEIITSETIGNYGKLGAGLMYGEAIGRELGKTVLMEDRAKTGVGMNLLEGGAMVFGGLAGGAKSLLMSQVGNLVGIPREDVSYIPHESDLSASKIGGSNVETTEVERDANGQITTSKTRSVGIKPILRQDSKLMLADEVSRTNPYALNNLLDVMEDGTLITDEGVKEYKEIEAFFTAMNPSERDESTFKIAQALADRHSIGVIMGNRNKADYMEFIDKYIDFEKGIKSEQVITLDALHMLRQARKIMQLGESRELLKQYVGTAHDALNDNGVKTTGVRFFEDALDNSRTLAFMDGGKTVGGERNAMIGAEHIREGVRYAMDARFSMLGTKKPRQMTPGEASDAIWTEVQSTVEG